MIENRKLNIKYVFPNNQIKVFSITRLWIVNYYMHLLDTNFISTKKNIY